MPYLTPDDVPESATCRALLIPASTDWLAIFSGALTELSKSYNWQQQGITVEEALAVVNAVLAGYYDGCTDSGCTQPGGSPVVRLNPTTGAIEELVEGEWVEPTGDLAMPPTPPRGESTPEERKCLAAANAVNALHIMYESLSDSFAEAQGLETAINAMFAALVAIIGTAFALPLAALAGIFIVLMSAVYLAVEFVGADLWDEEFTAQLTCYFEACATSDGDVVHFDYQCVINQIGQGTTWDWTTLNQARLLLQVGYLLNVIGSQALDAAGAATAITSYECNCPELWCNIWTESGDPDLTEWTIYDGYGNYDGGAITEWTNGSVSAILITITAPAGGQYWIGATIEVEISGASSNNGMVMYGEFDIISEVEPLVNGTEIYTLSNVAGHTSDGIFQLNLYSNDAPATMRITSIKLYGNGTGQPWIESNCTA